MTTPTNPSPMAKTEQEGAIQFERGAFRCKLVSQAFAELAGPVDADATDVVLALQANPQLRASVLAGLGLSGLDFIRAAATVEELTEKLRAAESELQGLYAAFDGSGHAPKNAREAAQAIGQMHDAEAELAAERARVVELTDGLRRACSQIPRPRVNLDWHLDGGDNENTDPSPTERHSGKLGTVPGQFPEPQQQGERVMPVCAADNCGLPCNDLTAYRVIRDGERFDYCCVECAIGHARSLGEASAEEAIQEVETERDALRRELEEAEQKAAALELCWQNEIKAGAHIERCRGEALAKLQAAEAELVHTREAAELLRDSCADGDLAFRLRLEQWASRDQKRAATTEEQRPSWMPKVGDMVRMKDYPQHRPVKVEEERPGWRFLLSDGPGEYRRDCHVSNLEPAATEEQAAPAAVESRPAQLIRCDFEEACPGHADPMDRPCEWEGEQESPAKPELPGGKGPDYVTRAELVAALRTCARDDRHSQGYANQLLDRVADALEAK